MQTTLRTRPCPWPCSGSVFPFFFFIIFYYRAAVFFFFLRRFNPLLIGLRKPRGFLSFWCVVSCHVMSCHRHRSLELPRGFRGRGLSGRGEDRPEGSDAPGAGHDDRVDRV